MTGDSAFGLLPTHLGRHLFSDEIHLHARVSALLDAIRADVPGCNFDLRDRNDDVLGAPQRASDFVRPVEEYDVPETAPHTIVADGTEAAARLAAAFPDMVRRPYDGVAFELGGEHLREERFGLVELNLDLQRAIDSVLGDSPIVPYRVFDGEGVPVKRSRLGFGDKFPSGFEPRFIVFYDRRAAETFARLFPLMPREALVDRERIWRQARKA
jgi:hypothetical protein